MKIYLKYGLLYALGAILWTLLTYATGMDKMKHYNWIGVLSIVIPVTCIYLGIKEKRDGENNGFISYGKAFNLGISITMVSAVIYTAFSYCYFSFINPSMIDFAKEQQYQRMQESGMDELQIEKTMSYSASFMNPTWFTFVSFLITIIVGIVVSLIVSAILKRLNPEEIS